MIEAARKIETSLEPYLMCRNQEELDALSPSDQMTPIVLIDAPDFKTRTSSELVMRLRSRKLRNPIVYYVPMRKLSPQEKVAFLDAGGDAVVDQGDIPAEAGEISLDRLLMAVVHSMNRSVHEYQESKERINYPFGLSFDTRTRDIYVNDTKLILTAYEFLILEAYLQLRLLAKDGEHVPTLKLSEAVYGDTTNQHHASMAVMISNINKKLAPYGFGLSGDLTRNNIGYSLKSCVHRT